MKISLESFDFTQLKPDSVLMLEVSAGLPADMQSAMKTVQALKAFGKIPKETFCLLVSKQHPISLREIPENVMNENGWFKMKPVPPIKITCLPPNSK